MSGVLVPATLRRARSNDVAAVSALWHRVYHEPGGHSELVGETVSNLRSLESLTQRTVASLVHTTVACIDGAVVGFCMIVGCEVEEIFLDKSARGRGMGLQLLVEAEARILGIGNGEETTAFLYAVAGNHAALRFYEKSGWRRIGDAPEQYAAPALMPDKSGALVVPGKVAIPCWRFEKQLGRPALCLPFLCMRRRPLSLSSHTCSA